MVKTASFNKGQRVTMSSRHHTVWRLYTAGDSIAKISAVSGYTRRYVTQLVRQHLTLEWLALYRAFEDRDELIVTSLLRGDREEIVVLPTR